MDKRILFGGGAAVAIAVVLWLTMGSGSPADTGGQARFAEDPEPVSRAGAPASVAATQPTSSAEAPGGSEPVATPPTPAVADALPIDVSPGFEYLAKPASEMKDTDAMWPNWRRHQVLQAEPRDADWAPRTEASIRQSIEKALTDRGHDTQRLDLPMVECRTQGCEIQVTGRIDDPQLDFLELQQVLGMARGGPLRQEFDDESFSAFVGMSPDLKQFLYLGHVYRKKP